ncbi:MAG: ureidoglycolate lyase [Pseudomonadota bacterium]
MTRLSIPVEPLTAAEFAPFGSVIAADAAAEHYPINFGKTERYHALARADVEADGGHAIISLFRAQPLREPFAIEVMERHPLGSQAFMPLQGQAYLVIVAPLGELDLTSLRAFRAEGDQGVQYARGIWHHYCLPLQNTCDFLVVDREGSTDNCDEVFLAQEDQITLAW